jgi:16S rRNA (adenine1518-N6/adenine1519-N6)-dimethyltransferase
MSLLEETKRLLKKQKIHPKKALGQNFCLDLDLMKRMVKYANISIDDVVLEVGSGLGFLTELLSKTAKKVYAIEVDLKLADGLKEKFRDKKNVSIITGDVLKVPLPEFDKVVSNPPYSISSPLIFRLLERSFKNAVLTLQKDFAERLTAEKDGSHYGRISVTVYRKAETKILERIPKKIFHPTPKVDSSLIQLMPRDPPFTVINEDFFFDLVKTLFNQRRKKIKNSLKKYSRGINTKDWRILTGDLPHLESRVHKLSPEDLGILADGVYRRVIKGEKIFYEDHVFYVFLDVYKPAEDSFLVAENLKVKFNEKVLDVGTGCGILAILASEKASNVNAQINGKTENVEVRVGDLFDSMKTSETFDLIVFNPPYLPVNKINGDRLIEDSWSGGVGGRQVIDRFLEEAPIHLNGDGRILSLLSTLSDSGETKRKLEDAGLKTAVISEKKLDFETIFLIEAKKA